LKFELDHVFICVDVEAPEAERVAQFGLTEGPPNRHPGQGTANRRFFFQNGMLELLYVTDPTEARGHTARRTLLWERWSSRRTGACPFGICIRPADNVAPRLPFPAWEYRPGYLPGSHTIQIAESGTGEPMWIYLDFARRRDYDARFRDHRAGLRLITGLKVWSPVAPESAAARAVARLGIVELGRKAEHSMEIEFDGGQAGKIFDFSPELPLTFRF
jgi:hypothetical protein